MPNAVLKTVEEMKAGEDGELYKYVVVNGQYRFANHIFNHSELLNKDEKAEGAGLFSVWSKENKVRWENSYSSTLKIGSRQQDEDDIGELFKMRVAGRWE